MKILFTRGLWHGQAEGHPHRPKQFQQDYLSDSVLHGLKSLLGSNVVDSPRVWSMYKSEFETGKHNYSECYGRGFTVCGNLDETNESDNSDIETKIKSDYFDLVILGCIDMGSQHMRTILQFVPREKLIILDGHDITQIYGEFVSRGVYFKREINQHNNNLHPISFAFPKEKILHQMKKKEKNIAHVIPGHKETYIFTDEKSYYNDYAISRIGVTHKKAGWDCMRHYEIMANRCVPLFTDIQRCPEQTCKTLPKNLLVDFLLQYNKNGISWFSDTSEGESYYADIENRIYEHFVKNCDTETLAKYVLDKHKKVTN